MSSTAPMTDPDQKVAWLAQIHYPGEAVTVLLFYVKHVDDRQRVGVPAQPSARAP